MTNTGPEANLILYYSLLNTHFFFEIVLQRVLRGRGLGELGHGPVVSLQAVGFLVEKFDDVGDHLHQIGPIGLVTDTRLCPQVLIEVGVVLLPR